MSPRFTVAVVGGGPAGLVSALALSCAGAEVVLAAPPHRLPAAPPHGLPAAPPDRLGGQTLDRRTAALFAGSIELLKNLKAWDAIAPLAAPISAIRIIDDTGGLLRAPEVMFAAHDVGLDAFGWNVPNAALVAGLTDAARQPGSRVSLHETAGVSGLELGGQSAVLTTQEGQSFEARLAVGADGRHSMCRAAAGIGTRAWSYAQSAIATTFQHSRPHHGISTEFHRPNGPLTTVPLPGSASSLVWVESPAEAQRLAGLDDVAFRAALEERLCGLLGPLGEIGPRSVFPLSGLTASRFGQNRVALVGEAAHVIPPIGAQGLNLGFRDAATLAECVADALGAGQDPGGAEALTAYTARRHPDVRSRVYTIDLLNRSLISGILPVHLARGLGLIALKAFGPLRRLAIREGLQPSTAVPVLLQQDGTALLAERRRASSPHAAA